MTTNAQAALQAAATWLSNDPETQDEQVTLFAGKFKAWLDGQDDADRKARHAKNVAPKRVSALDLIDGDGTPGSARRKGAGNMDGVAPTRAQVVSEPTESDHVTPASTERVADRVSPPYSRRMMMPGENRVTLMDAPF